MLAAEAVWTPGTSASRPEALSSDVVMEDGVAGDGSGGVGRSVSVNVNSGKRMLSPTQSNDSFPPYSGQMSPTHFGDGGGEGPVLHHESRVGDSKWLPMSRTPSAPEA